MAVEVKLDLHGSSQTTGVSSIRFDRAIRRGIVRGLDNDNDDNNDAILAAIDAAGLYHHSRLNLPLQQIRATKFGLSKAWVELIYARGQVTAPSVTAESLIRTATSYEHVPVYRAAPQLIGGNPSGGFDAQGLPTGPIHGIPTPEDAINKDFPAQSITPWMLRRPTVKLFVHTFLQFHPYSWIAAFDGLPMLERLGKINDANLVFGNFLIPKWWLRFDGARCDTIEQSNGLVYYDVDYEFTIMRGGHVGQALAFNYVTPGAPPVLTYPGLFPNQWVTPVELRHPEVFMGNGAFPYHTVVPP